MSILGRADEIAFLNSIYESNRPELLAVYGRRRVGKTYLIQHQFKEKGIYFELTGIYNASLQQQLQNFSFAYAEAFAEGEVSNAPGNWLSAFNELWKKIQAASTAERIILFFDELPWLASPKSNFLNSLEHFWNRYVSNDQRVIMIVCGSAASWMIKHVINNRGGLHGRLTRKLKLLPYNLAQTEHYLQKNKIELTRKQIVELYMVTGGIPKYLSLVERGKSIPQIINDLCFSSNSFLAKEFENIYTRFTSRCELRSH